MGEPECREWLRYARDDLGAAGILLDHYPRKTEIICYHSQQAVEKYLKAMLALRGEPIPRTHSLFSLVKAIGLTEQQLESVVPSLAILQPYAVEIRYPFRLVGEVGMEEQAYQVAKNLASFFESLPGFSENQEV